MLARWKILKVLLVAAIWVGVCMSQAHGQLRPPGEKANADTLDAWRAPGTAGTSKSADSPSTKVPPEKKEKRANTPPGKDRAGDAPASGAVVDPAGTTTK